MKLPKTSTLVAAAALTIGLTAAGVGITYAASNVDSPANHMNNLVGAIATRFNLNTADVQKVFDEQHAQMHAQKLEQYKTQLQQAVANGKLTQEQADKIVAKAQEFMAQRQMDRSALEQWAKDNNIPTEFLRFGINGRGGPGPGMGIGHMNQGPQ